MYSEYDAAAEFKVDPLVYFSHPREVRAAMVGYVLSSRAVEAMRQWDTQPKKKKRAKE